MNPYYSHQQYLTEELGKLSGRPLILEFGVGDGSSSVLRSFAIQKPEFRIRSYESDGNWLNKMKVKYPAANYCFNYVASWDKFFEEIVFDEVYDLVFVDSSPWDARIQAIDAVRKTAKVIILHDYDWFNKGVTEDIYSTKKGSFYHTKYGKEFKFEGYHEIYPGTLIMRKK